MKLPPKESATSAIVDGTKLRNLRLKCGLTQAEFARRSGYSERVLRKGEASGTLKFQTIRDLVDTLISFGMATSVSDIIITNVAIAKSIAQQFIMLERKMLSACERNLSNSTELLCHANGLTAPFMGSWKTYIGLQTFLDSFFDWFTISKLTESASPIMLAGNDQVLARFSNTFLLLRDTERKGYIANMHFHFRNNCVWRIQFDLFPVLAQMDTTSIV